MEAVKLALERVKQKILNESINTKVTDKVTAIFSCPYNLCDGCGIIVNKKDDKLVGKQCQCLLDKNKSKKMAWANIPLEFRGLKVKDYDTELYTNKDDKLTARAVKKIAIEYVNKFSQMLELGKGMYFYSNAKGSGKTRLAISIGNALLNKYDVSLYFTSTIKMLDEIKNTFNNKRYIF